jgi:micrococcal nuclease
VYTYKAIVTNVVDGDTVDVTVDLGFKIHTVQRIRLAGIDTPERGQPGYYEAKERLRVLCADRQVLLTTTKISKFGYYLGVVTLIPDVFHPISLEYKDVNDILIEENLAKPYDGGKKE